MAPSHATTDLLRAAARGNRTYKFSRHKIALSLLANSTSPLEPLNRFLNRTLFEIKKHDWVVLGFNPKDWPVLDRLMSSKSAFLNHAYEQLVCNYILANCDRVKALYEAGIKASTATLLDDASAVSAVFDSLDRTDKQSLFAFRLFAAQRLSNEMLLNYFKVQMSTDWLRKRFLHPFIYYSLNHSPDYQLKDFLSYILSGGIVHESEREVISFLLCDEADSANNKAFKYYAALLCHPYDACEIFLNNVENKFARDGAIEASSVEHLTLIAGKIPCPRILALKRLVTGEQFPLSPGPSQLSNDHFNLPTASREFFNRFVDVEYDEPLDASELSKPLSVLARLRSARYPTVDDFTYLVQSAQRFRFIDAGRLMHALLLSIFMVQRREAEFEAKSITRLVAFFGGINPFICSSPSASWALDRGALALPAGVDRHAYEADVELLFKPSNAYDSRLWIKAVHWRLRNSERQFKISGWLQTVRNEIRVMPPPYLSGIDWVWVDQVIKLLRVQPFRGAVHGVYALLLMLIENRRRDPTFLRSAIEPFFRDRSFDEVIEWLISEYESEAVAFVRYFLVPENILLSELSSNYTAALSVRIAALETCVRKFGFGNLLDEETFRQEIKALTTTLLLTNVHAGQFEIPWDIFRKDIIEKELHNYDAYKSLSGVSNELPLLGKSRLKTPHRYRNGHVTEYEFENNVWPLAVLFISIVDGFIEHPSFGIEVLLSTRFRHDTVRREFERVLEEAKSGSIPSVAPPIQKEIMGHASESVLDTVDAWLDTRMRTKSSARPNALFDVTPTQAELADLCGRIEGTAPFDRIVEEAIQWIRHRLEPNVATARQLFSEELWNHVVSSLDDLCTAELQRAYYRPSDVARTISALKTSMYNLMEELANWFVAADAASRPPLTFWEMKAAAEGVFERQISSGSLRIRMSRSERSLTQISADKVRLCFDLFSEVFANAVKYGPEGHARVRISAFDTDGLSGFLFTSLASSAGDRSYTVSGERYTSLTDEIFREGNSGLKKIAAVAATMADRNTQIRIRTLPQPLFVTRAATVNEAELLIEERDWTAILLDISMDITSSKRGPKLGGHATLGGLSIATKMYLLSREAPTIIVTAFDSFETFSAGKREYAVGLEEIEGQAKEILGDYLKGCVRYGAANWESKLQQLMRELVS